MKSLKAKKSKKDKMKIQEVLVLSLSLNRYMALFLSKGPSIKT